MNLNHLNLFKDIARERSITRGAESNGISQSAASQHLSELERSLDVKLLDRGTRPLKLTDAGRLYYQFCRDVLRRREVFEVDLDQMKRRVEGSVRVASIYSIGLSEMSRMESG
ncbi:MAG: LysR family transcriptional regulator, partial [bacterium]|nr:LysR family transcriptional regulator [bacterium]